MQQPVNKGKSIDFCLSVPMAAQLQKVTEIVEQNHIVPAIDSHVFSIKQANEALQLVAQGPITGKVIIRL